MTSQATLDNSPLDFIVVWKLRDKLRRVGTRLVSTTEKGIDD